jgi:hypothetical protein
MRDIVGLPRECDFGVGGDFDFARAVAMIGDRDAAHLRVVLGDTATSSVVVRLPSLRMISARSSENVTS